MIDSDVMPPIAASDPLGAIAAALFRPMGVPGVYARTEMYLRVQDAVEAYITRLRDKTMEVLRFPPVMSLVQLERSGYLQGFPHLLGCVCSLHGSETFIRGAVERQEVGGDWTKSLSPSDLVLSPAACYPLYPLVAARGRVPDGGLQFDIEADCFRHEPSEHLDRLQSFRMREFVCIGTPQEVTTFREHWIARAPQITADFGLPGSIELASDPFFGRIGQVMAVSQRQQALKYELLIPFHATAQPTACMSFNYHRDHFSGIWSIRTGDAVPAHTGCVAFGVDRLSIALFAVHGLDLGHWPLETVQALML